MLLCLIASLGRCDHFKFFISNYKPNLNQANAQGETPLLLAIKNSHWTLVKLLLNMGADVNKPEPSGTIATPLFNAVWRGKSEVVRQLVECGAKVDVGSCRSTPLFMAARLGCLEITKILLDSGCEKDIQNRFGVTALYEAVLRGQVNIVRLFLDCGCDPNLPDTYGLTPLHLVAQELHVCSESKEILQLLVEGGGDVTLINGKGETAADIAIKRARDWVLIPILEKGSALNLMVHRRDAITVALQSTDIGIAEILIKAHPYHVVEPNGDVVITLTGYSHVAVMLTLSGIEDTPLIYSDNIHNDQHREFLRKIFITPHSLQIYCRFALRKFLGLRTLYVLKAMKFPKKIEDFLLMDDLGVGFTVDKDYLREISHGGSRSRRSGGSWVSNRLLFSTR